MFTQIQDIVHIFFPILHVKMDGHLKINTESYTLWGEQCIRCTFGGLVNKENTPFVQELYTLLYDSDFITDTLMDHLKMCY